MRKNILVVADYRRSDFVMMFNGLVPHANVIFVEHSTPENSDYRLIPNGAKIIYWKDFKSSYDLLKKESIDKIVFLFIESYYHICLRVASKKMRIPTVHLEHGIRMKGFKVVNNLPGRSLVGSIVNVLKKIKLKRLRSLAFDKFFIINTVLQSDSPIEVLNLLKSRRNDIDILANVKYKNILLPDNFISFSQEIFSYHKEKLGLVNESVTFIGFPQFDSFFKDSAGSNYVDDVLLIDQCLVEHNIAGWTFDHKRKLIENLLIFCQKNGVKLFVKSHPYSRNEFWNTFRNNAAFVLLDNAQFDVLKLKVKIVVGWYSTLLMPFAAMKQTTLFCITDHLELFEPDPANFFINNRVAAEIDNVENLCQILEKTDSLHEKQVKFKEKFTNSFLYYTDGISETRLINSLLS